ncbi:UNVERIFIED_CONTAM: hypothetical protein PYX00_005292 [Menopon gallinae]|uniref:Nitrogen permease regulator 2-like protein n=1 Tax=Menopon gallinae TaxID=328185 RepID=A0AAW2HRI0_9NEOP
MEPSSQFYEGCGREGPIKCIFLSEFHPTAGPKITCQVPENYISKDKFDTVSVYIIPKAQLQRSTITVTLVDIKILGFPVKIDDKRYARNAFYFNLCFVCDPWARTVHYEPVLKKLSDYLVGMELEFNFLSLQDEVDSENIKLSNMLTQVMNDLNTSKMCTLTEGTITTHLKVVKICADPIPVQDHQVPIFIENRAAFCEEQWDLTTQQVLPFIDGFNHISKIAAEADVENNLVKSCVQNLVYYGVVSLIPIFQYSNVYAGTAQLRKLAEDPKLQKECLDYVTKSARHPPSFRDVFIFYASMTRGTTVKDLCIRLNPHSKRINERKLVQFGVLHGFIQRIYKGNKENSSSNPIYRYMNGVNSSDEICCATGMQAQQLEELVDKDPNLILIWK